MKNSHKFVFAAVSIILISFILIGTYVVFQTPRIEIKQVQITGFVFNDKNLTKSDIVRLSFYDAPFGGRRLPVGERITNSDLKWSDSHQGKFLFNVQLPLPVKVVVDDERCTFKEIEIKENEYTVEVNFTMTECSEKENVIKENPNEEIDMIERRIRYFQNELSGVKLTDEQRAKVSNEASQASYTIDDAKNENNLTKKYVFALRAHLFLERAVYALDTYKLGLCLEKANSTLQKFDPLYFVPPYEEFIILNRSKTVYDDRLSERIFSRYPDSLDDNTTLINEIYSIINFRDQSWGSSYLYNECEEAVRLINDRFEFQERFYNEKVLFLIAGVIVMITIGMIFEFKFRLIRKLGEKINQTEKSADIIYKKYSNAVVSPKNLTILLTVNGFIGGIYYYISSTFNNPAWNSWLLVSLVFAFGSIICILVSLFNDDKKYRKWATLCSLIGLLSITLPLIVELINVMYYVATKIISRLIDALLISRPVL